MGTYAWLLRDLDPSHHKHQNKKMIFWVIRGLGKRKIFIYGF